MATDLATDGHFVTRNGKGIFLLGEINWDLMAMSEQGRQDYLDNLKSNGFNLVLTDHGYMTFTGGEGFETRNAFGDSFFLDEDVGTLNPATWDRVANLFEEARERDMQVYFCLGSFYKRPGRFVVVDRAGDAYRFGNAIGRRFGGYENVIWSPGGDSQMDDPDRYGYTPPDLVDALAEGLADGVNGVDSFNGQADYSSLFMTYQVTGPRTTADLIYDREWIDINGFMLVGQELYADVVPLAVQQYEKEPVKPGWCHEPSCALLEKERHGWSNRFEAYWSVFAGSFGHVYISPEIYDPVNVRSHWKSFDEALKQEGRIDLKWLRRLIESKPILGRIPDQSLIVSDVGTPGEMDYICAIRGEDGSYAFIYSTNGNGFDVELSKLSGPKVTADWYDPRSGVRIPVEYAPEFAQGRGHFQPPGRPGVNNDWVLILESSGA